MFESNVIGKPHIERIRSSMFKDLFTQVRYLGNVNEMFFFSFPYSYNLILFFSIPCSKSNFTVWRKHCSSLVWEIFFCSEECDVRILEREDSTRDYAIYALHIVFFLHGSCKIKEKTNTTTRELGLLKVVLEIICRLFLFSINKVYVKAGYVETIIIRGV